MIGMESAQTKKRPSYTGLTQKEAKKKLLSVGKNEIEKKGKASPIKLLISQFTSPLIIILLVAAGVTAFLGDWVDTYVILAAVVLNTVLGFYQEFKAQRSLEALGDILASKVTALRSGEKIEISADELVPGDLVYLYPGGKIPADGVVLSHKQLSVNESILTGESRMVGKVAYKSNSEEMLFSGMAENFTPVVEREEDGGKESVYMGTLVSVGVAEMVVVRTGDKTEVGTIAKRLSETIEGDTPLQTRLKKLSRFLTIVVVFVALLIFTVGYLSGSSFEEIFTLSVAVAVAAIPEGLAVSLTAILAIGMQRILK